MAAKKVGVLIKEARTNADMTQEQLARKISGLSASDISLAERGQKDLTQAQLKQIAKITGVTQASLINAAKETSSSKTQKKTETKKKETKKTETKKTSTSSGKTSMQLTATEKKIITLYREADAETKKQVLKVLKGEDDDSESVLEDILETVVSMLGDKKS
ncbi:MAG: helix-turn-helix transcriptional regulator [Clostridia bacterium]|nr:helix-turn-helix transcriptional regulator [Clostridia bacterium]